MLFNTALPWLLVGSCLLSRVLAEDESLIETPSDSRLIKFEVVESQSNSTKMVKDSFQKLGTAIWGKLALIIPPLFLLLLLVPIIGLVVYLSGVFGPGELNSEYELSYGQPGNGFPSEDAYYGPEGSSYINYGPQDSYRHQTTFSRWRW